MGFKAERYPRNWRAISKHIREVRAGGRCECAGECGDEHEGDNGRCDAPNGALIVRDSLRRAHWSRHEHTGVCCGEPCGATKVVLTVAHLDHNESNNHESNLIALCQRCHLKLDGRDNLARRREREAAALGQKPLPALAVMPEHRGVR